jgi:hypothetical protein
MNSPPKRSHSSSPIAVQAVLGVIMNKRLYFLQMIAINRYLKDLVEPRQLSGGRCCIAKSKLVLCAILQAQAVHGQKESHPKEGGQPRRV